MKPTEILEPNHAPVEIKNISRESANILNVMVVYQDSHTRNWARQTGGSMTALITRYWGGEADEVTLQAKEDNLHRTWWNLNELQDPETMMAAIEAASRADAMIISTYDAKPVPAQLRELLQTWICHEPLAAKALIALITQRARSNNQPSQVREYLRKTARDGRLDFLVRERVLPASPGFFYIETIADRSNDAAQILRRALATRPLSLAMSH